MESVTYTAAPYVPTAVRSGLTRNLSLLRLKNMLLTGVDDQIYLQNYLGSLSLSETIPTLSLTGTISGSSGSKLITGTGTLFLSELRQGQFVFAGTELLVVDGVATNTSLTVCRALTANLSGVTGKRMPVLFEMNRKRTTLIQGNAVEFDKGNIFGAGVGTLRVNGSVLPGTSLVLSGRPRIAEYNPATGNYTCVDLGMDTPTAAPTLTSVAGGAKNMQAGTHYSIRLVPSRSSTNGFNNPGPKTEVDIVTNGDRIEVDVSAVSPDTTHNQTEWDVYGSLSTQGGIQGPWFFIETVTITGIVGNKFNVEWNDAEIGRGSLILDFDNDAPPSSVGFVMVLEGNPVWCSCYGPTGNSPGPSLVPARPGNSDAAPSEWVVTSSPPETLLGGVTALARLHFLTPKSLQQAIFAPTGDPTIPPVSLRPYWHTGFSNPYQLVFVDGTLVGYAHQGPTKSIADAEEGSEEYAFGLYVAEIMSSWIGGHVLVAYDPESNGVCFFHSADSKNTAGYWQTRVLVWGMGQGAWIGDVMLSDSTRDMIVCGVATVDNKLEFLAGGRLGSGVQIDTFRFNQASGASVSYSAAWQLTNGGVANQNKSVRYVTTTAKLTSGVFRLFGFDSATNINITDIENGTSSVSGDISLGTQTDVRKLNREEMVFPDLAVFCPQISGTYSGSGDADRIDSVLLEYLVEGVRR